MIKKPLVSIIIVNYNGKKYLDNCLKSIFSQNYKNFEVIISDNNSTDGSIQFIKENYPQVKYIINEENYGFAKGNNVGAKIASGDYLFFLNNDTIIDKNCLVELVKEMNNDVGIVTSKLLFMDDISKINCVGGLYHEIGIALDRGVYETDIGQYEKLEEVSTGFGAAMLMKKDLFEYIGGFDEDFFLYAEDVDLSITSKIYGYKIIYNPRAIVYHKGSGSASKINSKRVWYMTKNLFYLIVKNYSLKNLIIYLPLFFVYRSILAGYYLLTLKPSFFYAVFLGIFDGIKHLPKMIEKRKIIQKNRKKSDIVFIGKLNMRELLHQIKTTNKYHSN